MYFVFLSPSILLERKKNNCMIFHCSSTSFACYYLLKNKNAIANLRDVWNLFFTLIFYLLYNLGPMREIDVIDVSRQDDIKMIMREWTEYYNSPNREKIFNVISLEFSNTK